MDVLLIIVSALLIAMVLLQSGKASGDAAQIISGGNAMLFAATKERGSEKFITRFTYVLGITFIILALLLSF